MSNSIVEENRKAGTTDWLLFDHDQVQKGSDDLWSRRREVEGYCSHATIRAGQALQIFVSTDPIADFKIDFYRLGYYGGAGGRWVHSSPWISGTTQPTPRDGEKKLIECKWKSSYELTIPADWLSGVYLGKLQIEKPNRAQAYVIFILRDDRKADILFQCSDLTWQSYNRWPAWRSAYDFEGNKWHTGVGNEVGFDRPYSIYINWFPADYWPISNGSGEFLMWEFPLAFWLEKEGYDITYISNLDTHVDPDGLLRARGFLSVGHDEYWTQEMFENVARARDAGVNLAFLSGNSISGKIYLKESTDGRANRVFGRIKRWPNEQELMGSKSYGVGVAYWNVVKPEHWLFQGTGMKVGEGIKDLVGWEFHGQPVGTQAGLEILATSPVRPTPREAVDPNPMRVHAATIYDGPKGSFVFNAGTCWWSMVLSSPPGFTNPPDMNFWRDDPRVQRMTHNLLKRMIG